MCGDWNAADDLVQVALTKLFLAWHRVDAEQGPDAYARRILANTVIDDRRRAWRRESAVEYTEDVPHPYDAHAQTDERLDLAAALARLPTRQRVTLVLRFWMDTSVAQTAEILQCSTGTVKSQTASALNNLRSLFDPSDLPATIHQEPT